MRGKADGAANTWDSYPCANVWEDNGLGYCRDFNCTSMILVTTRCERGGSAVDEEHREDYRIRIRIEMGNNRNRKRIDWGTWGSTGRTADGPKVR